MKEIGFDVFNSTEERLANRPSQVVARQWPTMVDYWMTEDHKKTSKRNKENRSKKAIHHRAGSKSFARCKKELEARLKRVPNRVDIFKETYGNSSKQVDEEVTNNIGSMIKQLQDELLKRNGGNDTQGSEENPPATNLQG